MRKAKTIDMTTTTTTMTTHDVNSEGFRRKRPEFGALGDGDEATEIKKNSFSVWHESWVIRGRSNSSVQVGSRVGTSRMILGHCSCLVAVGGMVSYLWAGEGSAGTLFRIICFTTTLVTIYNGCSCTHQIRRAGILFAEDEIRVQGHTGWRLR